MEQEQFALDVRSLFWFSYRKDFSERLAGKTSDAGWGCCIRAGQMMLAHSLVLHWLGKGLRILLFHKNSYFFFFFTNINIFLESLIDWKRSSLRKFDDKEKDQYLRILALFEDSSEAPLSIHSIANLGNASFGKAVGEWFGPSTFCTVIRQLWERYSLAALTHLQICLASDTVLYFDEIDKLGKDLNNNVNSTANKWKRSVLILVPIKLGSQQLNKNYIPSIQELFKWPQFIGIVGGKPNAAYYFTATAMVGDSFDSNCSDLYYLDPHHVQKSIPHIIDLSKSTNHCIPIISESDCETFHWDEPLPKLPFTNLDPSMALGFYCSTREDFLEFWSLAQKHTKSNSPIFAISETMPDWVRSNEDSERRKRQSQNSEWATSVSSASHKNNAVRLPGFHPDDLSGEGSTPPLSPSEMKSLTLEEFEDEMVTINVVPQPQQQQQKRMSDNQK